MQKYSKKNSTIAFIYRLLVVLCHLFILICIFGFRVNRWPDCNEFRGNTFNWSPGKSVQPIGYYWAEPNKPVCPVDKGLEIRRKSSRFNGYVHSQSTFNCDNSNKKPSSALFPNKYILSAGADYAAWNGALLIGKFGSVFGVRVDYYYNNEFYSDRAWSNSRILPESRDIKKYNSIYDNVVRADSYAADGSYAEIQTNEINLEWIKLGEQALFCRVKAMKDIRARVEMYRAYGFPSEYFIQNGEIHGKSVHVATFEGEKKITGGHARYTGRYMKEYDESEGLEYCRLHPYGGIPDFGLAGNEANYEIDLKEGEKSCFIVIIGEEKILDQKIPIFHKIEEDILKAEDQYKRNKLAGTGKLGIVAEHCMNEMLWMNTYFPYEKTLYFPPGRPWMVDGSFNIWGWDESFNGIIVSCMGDIDMIERQFRNTLTDERMGLFSIWCAYSKYSDKKVFREFYYAYKKVYPVGDCSLVLGGKNNARVGNMDDTPMRELWRGFGEMYSLDMSCIKCWSLDILSRIANEIGLYDEAIAYDKDYQAMKQAINDTFWNSEQGIYLNRYISGEWPLSKSPTSFYPLLCGAPTQEMASLLINNLLDEKKFWGTYVIPSLSKDDYEYGKPSRVPHNGQTFPPYCYWRGAIWPPLNYLVYQGLKRYHFDEVAALVAQKSVTLWWETYFEKGWACENYNPETGQKSEMSHKHQSWSQLLSLMGIQELIDAEIWEKDAMMFGTLLTGSNTLNNFMIKGHRYSITIEDTSTVLYKDDSPMFKGIGGKFNIRNFAIQPEGIVNFRMNAFADIQVEMFFKKKKISFIVPKGIHNVKIIDQTVDIAKIY